MKTVKTKVKAVAKPVKPVENGKFFSIPFKKDAQSITFKLPISVVSNIELGQKAYCSITNGVLQISGKEPFSVIPMLSLTDFQQVDPE